MAVTLRAEKILKEVLVLEPERLDVLLKLAEVYSGQKNLVLFDEIAHVVSKITNKTGCLLGEVSGSLAI